MVENETVEKQEAKPEQKTPVSEAKEIVERLEKANKELREDLLPRIEEARANAILGGLSSAGQSIKEEPEISPQDYAMNALRNRK